MNQRMNARWGKWIVVFILSAAGIAGAATYKLWLPWAQAHWQAIASSPASDDSSAEANDDHSGHDHGSESSSVGIALSPEALKNVGFQPLAIEPRSFIRTINVPAMIVERPGRSQIHITAPLTGVITRIAPIQGVAVDPATEMFEIRLTYEELVTAQSDLIRTAESLDVVNREIERLSAVGDGVIAGRRILDQEYEKQKLEATLRSSRQALLLHGLSEEQVDSILINRQLFQSIIVSAPTHLDDADACTGEHMFHVQELPVSPGQQVEAGQTLCVLADHCELYIEGRAFEDDASRLREAARNGWTLTADVLEGSKVQERITGLKMLYLADQVDSETRAFRFYVSLPNQIALDHQDEHGQRFLDWRFKPGQRMTLQIPVETWENRIVLPAEAVVLDGAEAYVYRQNGTRFDQVTVHVEYRDRQSVVIANDGALFRGDIVASRGAYQIHLALKNQAGGGIDPHAGHNH